MMNFFYEKLPTSIWVDGKEIGIITDFREYIKFYDMIKSDELSSEMKLKFVLQYFEKLPENLPGAIKALGDFFAMEDDEGTSKQKVNSATKKLFSYSIDFPYILSAFQRDYNIDLLRIPYMHWWKFRMLFDGLSEDNEIKKRMMYRGIDIGSIKDPEEKNRIMKIQESIALEENQLTDYDIGDAFW